MGQWYHLALVRNGSNNAFYVNGVSLSSATGSHDVTITTLVIGGGYGTEYLDGRVSNARFTQGQALYTSNFTPPTSALTTTSQGATGSNVKLLCCQSTSSTTAATVTPSGSITANGDPYASSQTIQLATEITLTWPSSIKWDGGIAPTLDQSNLSGTDVNVINLLTRDEGVTWYGWETVSKSATSYQLWLWGYNVEGMLGQNNVAARSSPVQVSGHWSENIETREKSTLASKVDGTLWSWGSNDEGRLGHNNLVQYSSPVQIPGTTWDKVMTSHTGGYALKTDDTLWAWGRNTHGNLAQNDVVHRSSPVQVPGKWDGIFANRVSMYAVKNDGTAWTSGDNHQGQLGLNDVILRSSPTQIPGTTWSSDSRKWGGGWYNVVTVKTDGTLWSWGYQNNGGELGQNNRTRYSSPTQVGSETTWKYASGGSASYSMYGTKTDGTLWAWGGNGYGSLGQNDTTLRSSPVQIPGTTWDIVKAGAQSCIATKTDGTLWVWGWNNQGGLGLNQGSISISSPIQIPGTWSIPIGGTGAYNGGGLRGAINN